MIPYEEFLSNKAVFATSHGFEPAPCPEIFRPHQKDATQWAIRGGRRALFLAFGLGKTFVQLEIARQVCQHTGGRFLIVAPLGVRLEFIADAQKLGLSIKFARRTEECQEPGIYLTNYESVRDGKMLPHHFDGASLDEASVLRGFGGTKTFREFMRLFEGVRYKFVATATPSPNDYIDAHGFARSSGNTHLTPEHIESLQHDQIFKLYRDFSLHNVYDFEHHVSLCEALEGKMRLPVTFMLLQPASWSPEVWSDVTRMLTLNGAQSAKGREMHLCPMQFDIADRAIVQYTQPGEVVYDPFGGLMTVPVRAVRLGRFGIGCELNPRYFLDGCGYLKAEEEAFLTPTLFDLLEEQPA